MDLVDLLIILLLVGAFIRGKALGSIRQVFSTIGFILGLFLGSAISPLVVAYAHSQMSRALLTLLITLTVALAILGSFEFAGEMIKRRVEHRKFDIFDRGFGSLISIVTLLVLVWLGTTVIVKLPYPGLQNEIRSSAIVTSLNESLPPAPHLIASLGHLINPNGFPQVFTGNEPAIPQTVNLPSLGVLQTAVTKDQASVVKIEGQGCGGIVEGSGFVVANGIVATNAHVIAGVTQPYVIDSSGRHQATPIWFDPNLDIAVLEVKGLNDSPLQISSHAVLKGTPSAVLGYPGGGSFDAEPASVLDEFTAVGRNIYNQGSTSRDVYEIKGNVVPGNSGGPLIDQNGTIIGVVFAQSTVYNQVGYTLTSPSILQALGQAETRQQPVTSGSCAE